jgi:hypothetical protein
MEDQFRAPTGLSARPLSADQQIAGLLVGAEGSQLTEAFFVGQVLQPSLELDGVPAEMMASLRGEEPT